MSTADQTPSMPPLPEPDSYCTHADSHEYDVWNAEQMRAYAKAVADERVREALEPFQEIARAVIREQEGGRRRAIGADAPGHCHSRPGIWDDDNGKLAGKPCAWCMTWAKFRTLADPTLSLGGRQ